MAFSIVADELGNTRPIEIANLSEQLGRRDQKFSVLRVAQVLWLATSVAGRLRNASVVYLTIAQSRMGFLRDAMFIAIAGLWGRPIIAHLHGGNYASYFESENLFMKFLIRTTFRKLNRLIVLSNQLQNDFDFLGKDFATRMRTVRNASPLAVGRPRKAPRGEFQLLYLSNLLFEKGYMDCIDALPHLHRLLPNVRIKLVLAGSYMLGKDEYADASVMEATLRKHIRYLEIEDAVEIAGIVTGEAKQLLIDAAHLHLLPTYYQNKGQPITLIEALASGLPSVTTAWRGNVDIVEDGKTGIFVPPKNPLAIAEAIADLYRDPVRYERLSEAVIGAAQMFSRPLHVAEIARLFDEACDIRTLEF